ncbi:hypothetical protein ACQPZQ_32045 [Pseudonocardia sp. CA-142604]|uniref:hypothetical protein n=1 Tax=Pseudonocardia sp. CA-142604 TaxID=3240024 RepID=UPI003D8F5F4D
MNVRTAHQNAFAAVGPLISYSFDKFADDAFLASDPRLRIDVNAECFILITEHTRPHERIDMIDDADESELIADASSGRPQTEMTSLDFALADDTRCCRM